MNKAASTIGTNKRFLTALAIGLGVTLAACSTPPPPAAPPPPPAAPPPAPPPPPPPEPVAEPIKLPAPVKFAVASDVLAADSDAVLKVVVEYMTQQSKVTKLRIEGHTDNNGGTAPNQRLSEKRALAVAHWLVKNGVDCKRLVAVGFGESKPVGDNSTDDGRAQNRRTVFINAELDGKPIGGMALDGGGKVAGDPCSK